MSPVPRAEVSEVLPALQQEIARLAGLPEIRHALPGFACRKRSSRRGNWRWHALRRRHLGNGRAGIGWHRDLLTLGLRMFTATTWAMSSALVQDEERTMLRSARILILSFLRE